MPGELCRRDAVLTTLLKQYRSLAADDPDYVLEAADLNRAINPRWREGDPTPMPVRRAHTWGLR
jgi:hypothetical protein